LISVEVLRSSILKIAQCNRALLAEDRGTRGVVLDYDAYAA
jgi:hypothetical protein